MSGADSPPGSRRYESDPARGENYGFWATLGETIGHARVLASVQSERAKLGVRRTVEVAAIAMIVALAAVALAIAGVWLFASGLAEGLTELFDGRAWLGRLAAGVLLLGGLACATWLARATIERKEIARLRKKYEEMERNGLAPFGRAASGAPVSADGGGAARPASGPGGGGAASRRPADGI